MEEHHNHNLTGGGQKLRKMHSNYAKEKIKNMG